MAAPPSAQVIGNAFVQQYYQIQHHSPELVYQFYQDSSFLSRPDSSGVMTTVTNMKNINDLICSLDYKNCKAEIKSADAQESHKDGVIVLVTGSLTGKDNMTRKFTQTFFLAPQDKGYFVLNDVFRYVEEKENDSASEMANGTKVVLPEVLTPDPEPTHVVDPPNLDQPDSQNAVEVDNTKEKSQSLEGGKQVVAEIEIVVGPELHANENHNNPEIIEIATSVDEEDAPKKSYASIVSLATKKGPTKIYVPTNASKTAASKAEKKPVDVAVKTSVPEASYAATPEISNAEDEAEGYSIYVCNLPLDVTPAQLEVEFKRFGPIKQKGVQVRRNRQQGLCFGFVEFEDLSSMHGAVQASPVTVGGRLAVVEIKRTTTRVGGARGRFAPGRGGFRNDNFRGRGGYFGGGRGYMRNEFGGGQGYVRYESGGGRDFSGWSNRGRGGVEGYQQEAGEWF